MTLVASVVIAVGLGGFGGYLVGHRGDDRDVDETVSTAPQASMSLDADLGLDATLSTYLDALVAHDWRTAHDLMCVDLSEEVSAGSLKRELAGSEDNAGPLTGYQVVTKNVDETLRAVDVEYVLEFELGTANITAALEREGTQWRVCSFANHGGTGFFSEDDSGTG